MRVGAGLWLLSDRRDPAAATVPEVDTVKIDGVEVTEWAIVDGYKLVRTDGEMWPGSKNPLLPDTADDTFSITVTTGVDHTYSAKMAATELVCELAAATTGKATRLPAGTVSATMDGVSVQVGRLPGQEEIEAVGLTWLSRFMAVWGQTNVAEVRSPELDDGWTLTTVEFHPQ